MKKKEDINQVAKSLQTGRLLLLITNLVAAVIFFTVYVITNEIWYLILGFAMTAVAIFSIFFIKTLLKKINSFEIKEQ